MVPSFKDTPLIFPEISFIHAVFTSFQLQYYDIISDLICVIEKRTSVSLKGKREISKGKTPFFPVF